VPDEEPHATEGELTCAQWRDRNVRDRNSLKVNSLEAPACDQRSPVDGDAHGCQAILIRE
jgi:hypothetical protein